MRKMNKLWAFLAARGAKTMGISCSKAPKNHGHFLQVNTYTWPIFPVFLRGLRARGVVPIKDIYKKIKKENECGCWQLGCEPDARAGHYAFCESDGFFSSKGWMSAGSVPAGTMWRVFVGGVNLQRPWAMPSTCGTSRWRGRRMCGGRRSLPDRTAAQAEGKSARRSCPINANGPFWRSANNAVRLARRRRAPGTGFL